MRRSLPAALRSRLPRPPRLRSRATATAAAAALSIVSLPAIWEASAAQAAVVPNPDLTSGCGLDIAVILDERGTNGFATAEQMRDQVKDFVGSLVGTGARVSLTRFAATATVMTGATVVDVANNATLQAALDAVPVSNGTGNSNWEDALRKAQSTFASFGTAPDMVLMVTDRPALSDNDGTATPVDSAATVADAIRSLGVHVFAQGIGNAAGFEDALQTVFGPDRMPTAPVAGADYGFTGLNGYSAIGPALALKTQTCLLDVFPAATPAANPDLAATCGLDIAIVVDRSSSIGATGLADLKTALHNLLDGLADTGSRVSFASYGTQASVDVPATPVATGPDLTALHGVVDGYALGDRTNWAGGFSAAMTTFPGFAPGGRPDLVLHLTDGLPNEPALTTAPSLPWAVTAADMIKTLGTHVLNVGVGSAFTPTEIANLVATSGPDELSGTVPFAEADYTLVADYAALTQQLLEVVGGLCNGTVVVRKLVDGTPAADWTFTATNGPADVVTDATGTATFDFGLTAGQSATTTIAEVPQADFNFVDVTCTDASGAPIGTPSTNGVGLTLDADDLITCVFNNQFVPRPEIGIVTTTTIVDDDGDGLGDAGEELAYSYTVTNTGNVPLTDVTVTDPDAPGVITCTPTTLAPNAVATCTASQRRTITQPMVDTGTPLTNTGTATGTPPTGDDVTANDPDSVDLVGPDPSITVTITPDLEDDNTSGAGSVGENVNYTYTVRNTGNVTLTGVTVNDPRIPAITCSPTDLGPGAVATCTSDAPYVITQADVDANTPLVSTVTSTGTPPTGPAAVSDPASADVPVDAPRTGIPGGEPPAGPDVRGFEPYERRGAGANNPSSNDPNPNTNRYQRDKEREADRRCREDRRRTRGCEERRGANR